MGTRGCTPLLLFSLLIIVVSFSHSSSLQLHQSSGPRRGNFYLNIKPKPLKVKDAYSFKTLYFEEQLDHFGFSNQQTFKLRYLVADQFWNRNRGPIFFYTGNEGDIELFCNNTGFMWDIAPEFKAMLVFAEHRYYGKTLPFGPDTFKNVSNLNWLTSEQALADFAELIRYIKKTIPGAQESPVVAFGGSYGGMLSAWMRIKYPNEVVGALAASAPVLQFNNLTPCNAFYDTTSRTWEKASPLCVKNIHRAYQTLQDTSQQESGYDFISKTFNLCTPLTSTADLSGFTDMLVSMYVNYAMVDYPYPANFIADLPGWPVRVACSFLSNPLQGRQLLVGLSKVTNLYFNYSGGLKCLDWKNAFGGSLGLQGWDYQSCTEMMMPMCSNNTGLFYSIPWDFQAISDNCYKSFKVKPRQDWISLEYWGQALKSTSNIIFSNGNLDPWSSGGVLQTISDSVVAILIQNGAHHLDLRAKNPLDPPSVRNARAQELNIIRGWLHLTP